MTLAQFFDMHRVANPIVIPMQADAAVKFEITLGPDAQSEQPLPAFLAAARRRKKKQRSR